MGTEKRERQKANRAMKLQEAERQQSRRKLTRWIVIGVAAVVGVFLLAWIGGNVIGDEDEPSTPVTTVEPATTVEPVTTTETVTVPTTEGEA